MPGEGLSGGGLTGDELYDAVAHHRDKLHAELWALTVGLAAEKYPDVVREALARVFDVSAAEQYLRDVNRRAAEVVTRLADLERRLERAEARLLKVIEHSTDAIRALDAARANHKPKASGGGSLYE